MNFWKIKFEFVLISEIRVKLNLCSSVFICG